MLKGILVELPAGTLGCLPEFKQSLLMSFVPKQVMRTFETMNDDERKLWLNEHFFYEIQMMNGAIYRLPFALREEIDPQLKTNFILDLFLLHARNLIEFFYYDKAKPIPDDAFALQFIEKDADWEKLINENEAFLKDDTI